MHAKSGVIWGIPVKATYAAASAAEARQSLAVPQPTRQKPTRERNN
jgi:hypothetical protein